MSRFILSLLLILKIAWPGLAAQNEPAPIQKGILDLRECTIDENFFLKLDGEWEFYWDRFVAPEDFFATSPPLPDLYCYVPSFWSHYSINEKPLGGFGHGTYRLLILLPEGFRQTLAFEVPVFDAAYSLFLDDKFINSNGKTGTSEINSEGGYKPFVTGYRPASDTLSILFHVSNYQHRRGGFWKSMKIGDPHKIDRSSSEYALINYISLGVLLAFALFFFIFFLLFKEDKILLYFSLTLAGIFLRLISIDLYPVLLFTNISWLWLIRFEYLGSFIAFIFGMWYFYSLFPTKLFYHFSRINTVLSAIAMFIIVFFKVSIFSYTMFYFQPIITAFILFFVGTSFLHLFRSTPGKWAYFAGSIIIIIALINDILIANSRTAISNEYIIHFAIQVFVFIQAVMLIRKWIVSYQEKENLHTEIAHMNQNLENIVKKRTAQLESQNLEISKQKEKIENQNRTLQESLDFKNRFFSIIAHDLKSPIASLVQISDLTDIDMPAKDRLRIWASARDLVKSAANLIDNLLYWGRSQGNQIHYKPEQVSLPKILDETIALFIETAKQKSIKLKSSNEADIHAFIDKELMQIVFRNIISNALKFTSAGGTISMKTQVDTESSGRVILSVEDDGLGMERAVIDNLFENKEIISTAGTANEHGTGLGLRLCYDLVKINKGEMRIESTPGKGTTILLYLPAF